MNATRQLALAAVALTLLLPGIAAANRYEVRREVREGIRSVEREKREAEREIRRCQSRECARREIREGYREVNRERREARYEIRRELDRDRYRQNDRYYRNGRYYRDGRYWDPYEYDRRYRDRKDDKDLLKGVVIGAAVVGVAVAIKEAND